MDPLRKTATFKKKLTSSDVNNIVTVLDMNIALAPYKVFEGDYFVESSALIEEFKVTVGLFSLLAASYPETTALMSDAKKEAEIAKVRDTSQKMSLGIYTARGNGPWEYESEAVLLNQGGAENHLSLLVPFLSTNEAFLIDADFKLGVRIEAKWQHPLKTGDYLIVKGSYRQTINFLKKNGSDLDELNTRVKALETLLSLFGAATSSQSGTNGLVPQPAVGDNVKFLRGDRTWQPALPASSNTYGSIDVAGSKANIAGINFPNSSGSSSLLVHGSLLINGMWSASANANTTQGWLWWYDRGSFQVFSNGTNLNGTYIGISKSLGSLPGYPNERYPTLRTDWTNLYFAMGNGSVGSEAFTAYIAAGGTWTPTSDFYKKEIDEEIDCQEVLSLVRHLPIVRYHFKDSDPRIKRIGTFAQSFWLAFGCGGDLEVLNDSSPTAPNKFLATSDVAGVCLAGVKGLLERIEALEGHMISLSS